MSDSSKNEGEVVNQEQLILLFDEVGKYKNDKSSIWHYFDKEKNGRFARCKETECKKVLKTLGGTTTSMHRHLKCIHGKSVESSTEIHPGPGLARSTQPKQASIKSYTVGNQKDLRQVLARMTAQDGLPFSVFETSFYLREAIKSMGLKDKLPSSRTTIRKYVMEYSTAQREVEKSKISELKNTGAKFSIVFDEWTSIKNRRYINLMVRSDLNSWWNLVLIPVKGTLTAERNLSLVEEKLNAYNLSLREDIVSISTDGASVMTKIGKLTPTHQQLCLAHGIQLAVLDVLYRKIAPAVDLDSVNEIGVEVNNEAESYSSDASSENDDDDGFVVSEDDQAFNGQELNVNFKDIISKVRQVIKAYKRSPKKNENLQNIAKEQLGKEIKLLLDSKTRWSSLLNMLERFYTMRNCIIDSLTELNLEFTLEDYEISRIKEMICALQPVKLAVEAICRRDATLLTADAALNLALKKLKEANSNISVRLYDALVLRIKERRTSYSGLLHYIQTGSIETPTDRTGAPFDDVINIPSKKTIGSLIKSIIERFNPSELIPISISVEAERNESESASSSSCNPPLKKTKHDLQSEFQDAIQDVVNRSEDKVIPSNRLVATIKKEMDLLEAGGSASRGYNLERVYKYLKSIPPTSVEAERAFSAAGYICTKVRSSLSDESLDELCFLRTHFQLSKDN